MRPSRRRAGGRRSRSPARAAHRSASSACPARARDPTGEHREWRVLLDRPVADRPVPALHRRQQPELIGTERRGGDQVDGPRPFARNVEQVLDGDGRRRMLLEPGRRTNPEFGDQVGFHPSEFAEEELAEEPVVPIPLPPTVEGNQERVRCRQFAQERPPHRRCRGSHRTAVPTGSRAPRFAAGTAVGAPGGSSALPGRGSRR